MHPESSFTGMPNKLAGKRAISLMGINKNEINILILSNYCSLQLFPFLLQNVVVLFKISISLRFAYIQSINTNVNLHIQKQPREVFCGKRCSQKFHKIQGKTLVPVSFLIKFKVEACNLIKNETLAQVFFREFGEIYKNTFFYRSPPGDYF